MRHEPQQRIVVTGGAGFIGGLLVARLARAGHEATAVDLRGPVVCDVTVPGAFQAVLAGLGGVEAVYHLAGPVVEQTRREFAPSCYLQLAGRCRCSRRAARPT